MYIAILDAMNLNVIADIDADVEMRDAAKSVDLMWDSRYI